MATTAGALRQQHQQPLVVQPLQHQQRVEREQQRHLRQQQLQESVNGVGCGPNLYNKEIMVRLDDLYTVYKLARANKRRSEDTVVFEIDYEAKLSRLLTRINERTMRCDHNYAFISKHPQPREVFGSEFESRMIQWYVVWRMSAIFENELSERTFNNRIGMGVEAAVNNVIDDIRTASRGFTRPAYAIQWDLQGCFPNANCDIALAKLRELMRQYEGEDKEDLEWMALIAIHANPQRHFYRKSAIEEWGLIKPEKSLLNKDDGTGGVIGFHLWQTTMNIYYSDIDHLAVDEMGLLYTRFMDDTIMVVEDKEAALTLLPLFRERYKEISSTMHPRKFSCQEVAKGVKFLGSYIKGDRVYIANRTLRKARSRIGELNLCKGKLGKLDQFISTMNSYFGLLKNKNEFRNIECLWGMVGDGWKAYAEMDWDRLCVVAREGYKHNDFINYKFRRIYA